MKKLMDLLLQVMAFVSPKLQEIIREAVEAGKERTRGEAEALLDKLEIAASETTTKIDDAAVSFVREILDLPDLSDEQSKTPEPEKTAESQ